VPSFLDSIMGVIRVFDEASGVYRTVLAPGTGTCEQDRIRLRQQNQALLQERQVLVQRAARLQAARAAQAPAPPPPPPPPPPEVDPDDPYFILGVHEKAPDYVIKAAYKAAAKQVHSDAGGTDKDMARINGAMAEIARRRGWNNT